MCVGNNFNGLSQLFKQLSFFILFFLQVIVRHGAPAERFCNKDPFTLKSAGYLSEIFPNSKFIFMVRDGRATVHSIITRKVTITGFKLDSYRLVPIKEDDSEGKQMRFS